MPRPDIRTVFVTCSPSLDGSIKLYKVQLGRLGEFPTADRFAAFPDFAAGYAFMEAERLPGGRGWRFIRVIPIAEVHHAMLAKYGTEMKRVDHCRTRGPAPNPQATDW